MSKLSAAEHLKIARRLHFQGQNDEAVKEYLLVLEIDPDNEDAASGLEALGAEAPDTSRFRLHDPGSGVKTNFFVNQAKSSELSPWRTGPFKVIIACIAAGACYGLYQAAQMFMNFDSIKALDNVEANISKIRTDKNGDTTVSVKVDNFNPAPVKKISIHYELLDAKGNTLKSGSLKVDATVPAGDTRTFPDIALGVFTEKPDKIVQKKESVVYGPKPKLKDRLVDKFVEASSKPDKESFADFDDLTQDAEDFGPVLVGMGRAYAARADYKRAIVQYKKALEIDPEYANAHYYLAIALYYSNDKKNATKEMEQALTLVPDDPQYQESAKMLAGLKESNAKSKAAAAKEEKAGTD